jgi:hypothetical protein
MQKGKSTEVWYTGEDFINTGKAKDYSEYVTREIPLGAMLILSGGRFFAKSLNNNYVELLVDETTEYTYMDILQINQMIEEEIPNEEMITVDESVIVDSSSSKEENNEKKKSKRSKKSNKK